MSKVGQSPPYSLIHSKFFCVDAVAKMESSELSRLEMGKYQTWLDGLPNVLHNSGADKVGSERLIIL